mmetsp:Transcript_36287/g.108891  ORF Transcript_36287/g.108891 Transcript_36287/m.108891 type:complete len:347 (-) Transcript_36287:68-1108(-)
MRGGCSPFHYACLYAVDDRIVRELLQRAELQQPHHVKAVNMSGCTALHFLPFSPAFEGGPGNDAVAIRELLLEAGCLANVKGTSALWEGSRTAEELWAAEADGIAEGRPLTPSSHSRRQSFVAFSTDCLFVQLREAARVGDVVAVENWLAKHGGDYPLEPVPPDYGSSPLHYACGPDGDPKDKAKIVDALLQAGANVNHLNSYSASPLHFAVWHQQPQLVRRLLRGKCKTLTQRGDGARWDVPQTPIELAFRQAASAKPDTVEAYIASSILDLLMTAQYKIRLEQQTRHLATPPAMSAPIHLGGSSPVRFGMNPLLSLDAAAAPGAALRQRRSRKLTAPPGSLSQM